MFSLISKDTVFYELFEQAAGNVNKGAILLAEMLDDFKDLPEKARRMKDIEHAGDKFTHQTIEKLNQTFITPLDREDIHDLICRLDDIIDLIDTAVGRMVVYKIEAPTEEARALARVLVNATRIIMDVLPKLRTFKKAQEIITRCIEIHTQENEADRIEQAALASLFENGRDPIFVIKWKDIYQDLEAATDRCEDVANAIEAIVLKNA